MDQHIRFCTAADGVRIAYATAGAGPPFVLATGWPVHLELEWQKPFARAFLEELAEGFALVRYDMRGSGLSDRDVSDFSLDSLLKDLDAVVAQLELGPFALVSMGMLAGPISMAWAASHPERVSRLVLYGGYVRGADITSPQRQHALIEYTRSFGFPQFQFTDPSSLDSDDRQHLRDAQDIEKAATSGRMQAALLETLFSVDVTDQLNGLSMPTLILHARRDPGIPFALGRELAAQLPHARFVPFESSTSVAWSDSELIIPEVRRFLGAEVRERPAPAAAASSGLATVLFTDMEGSTTLTQRLGDARAQEVLRSHNAILREALKAHAGSEIKHTGDGIMASFPSASGALECAVAIQRAFAAHNQQAETPILVRVGLNAGEPVAEEQDLFGAAVQLAARVCAHASPGQVLVSNVVRELAMGKGFLFADQGDVVLRGFEDAVRVYEVKWDGE